MENEEGERRMRRVSGERRGWAENEEGVRRDELGWEWRAKGKEKNGWREEGGMSCTFDLPF